MPRPNKVTSSRSTPRPSTRSQQQSPPINKPSLLVTLKNPSTTASSSKGEVSDNDNDSVCSSSKSSDVVLARSSTTKVKTKDDPGVVKAPWRHPDELDYFRPYDWSEDKIISQLRSVVFTVPPPVFGKQSFIEITLYEGGDFDKPTSVKVPRGYRVPLMFVAKFQWASLKLVLTSAQREKEWSDYKFDILHLSRLCQRFFFKAQAACDIAVVEAPPVKTRGPGFQLASGAMTRKWRCPTFDRALARYNKNWLISREEFLRDFYIEFEDEEYAKDVLKIDWSRWALKGHKGFKLSQDELRYGIDGRMITRGLKRVDNGDWVWLDDYVIKQEEVAVAVGPITRQVTIMDSSADKPVAQNNDVQTQSVPVIPVPLQNGRSGSHSNRRLSPIPTPSAAPIIEQHAKEAVSTPQRMPVVDTSDQAVSNEMASGVTGEPLTERNMSHSPLSSISPSVSPSIPPPSVAEPLPDGVELSVSHPGTPTRSSGSGGLQLHSTPSPKHSPLSLSAPLTIIIPPSKTSRQSSPIRQESAAIGSPAPSEVTQPPKSPSAVSSPERRPPSLGPAPEAGISQPTQPGTSNHGGDPTHATHERDSEGSKASPETSQATEGRHSPTSIDSTPTPSPVIMPRHLDGSSRPTSVPAIPNTASCGPRTTVPQVSRTTSESPSLFDSVQWPQAALQDVKPPIMNTAPSQLTPYWLPPCPQPLTNQDIPTVRTNGLPRSPPRTDSPIFMSPLLPPANVSRSSSLDEIPGLGELSSRRPLTLTSPFAGPLTSQRDTEASSWNMSDQKREKVKQEVESPTIRLSYGPSEFPDEVAEVGMANLADVISFTEDHTQAQTHHHPPTSLEDHGMGLAPEHSLIISSPPSTPRPLGQNTNQGQRQSPDYDEDSDMDFGTPVTSPLIIVPGPKLDIPDALPLPVSPCPVRTTGSKHKDPKPNAETPKPSAGITPTSTIPRSITTRTTIQKPTTPRSQKPQFTADKTTGVSLSEETVVEKQGRWLESVNPESPINTDDRFSEKNNGKEVRPSNIQTAPLASSHPTLPIQPATVSPILTPPIPDRHPSCIPPLPPLSAPTVSPALVASIVNPIPDGSAPASTTHTPTAPPPATVPPNSPPLSSSPPAQLHYAWSHGPYPPPPNLVSDITSGVGAQARGIREGKNHTLNVETVETSPLPLTPVRNTSLDDAVTQFPFQLTSSHDQIYPNAGPSRASGQSETPTRIDVSQKQPQVPQSTPVAFKRRREGDEDDEDEEPGFKSRKRSEGLSVREGGIVVRKVVSMVRDTLTGLNDLLEIAAEQELIPSEKLRGRSKAKATSLRDDSPLYAPTPTSSVTQTPVRTQTHTEPGEFTRLGEELRLMKAEVAQLKEQKSRETPMEQDQVQVMRSELEALREQVRSLRETPSSQRSEVQGMRDEILSLKNEIRSFQSDPRRSPIIPSIPLTPSVSVRFNNHGAACLNHPLAHLLAAEPALTSTISKMAPTATQSQTESEISHSTQASGLGEGTDSFGQHQVPPTSPRSPAIFDDIPLPVKSKRKARMIFSRS